MEINKYKANIYTDFTILSFHRPTTHSHLKSTATLTPEPTFPKPHYPLASHHHTRHMNALFVLRPAKLWAFNFGHPCLFMNALPVSHPCETLGVQLWASMPVPCQREVLLPEKIWATTGGIASLPSIARTNPFQNRTIPLAFRRARVCVCFFGFASMPRQPLVPLHRATALCG